MELNYENKRSLFLVPSRDAWQSLQFQMKTVYTEGHSENNSSGPYLELLMKNFLVQLFTETKKGMCLQKPSLNLMSSELRLMVWEENVACLSMVYPV